MRLYRWNWEAADDLNIGTSFGMDFNAVARARYPLMKGRLELSVAMPVGGSVYGPNDEWDPVNSNPKPRSATTSASTPESSTSSPTGWVS